MSFWSFGSLVLWSCGPLVFGPVVRWAASSDQHTFANWEPQLPSSCAACLTEQHFGNLCIGRGHPIIIHLQVGGSFAPSTLWLLESRVCLPQIAACGHGAPQRTDLPDSICFQLCPLKGRVPCLAEQHLGILLKRTRHPIIILLRVGGTCTSQPFRSLQPCMLAFIIFANGRELHCPQRFFFKLQTLAENSSM